MSRFLRAAVDSRLGYALEQVERFETFHAANARLALKSFLETFNQDDVLSRVWAALRNHLDLSPADWHAAVAGNELPPLPTSPPAAMAFRLAVLRYAQREKIDLRHFVSNHFPGEHLNARLMGWKRLFVHPFAADLRLLVERLPRHLPAGEWVDLDPALASCLSEDLAREGFGPRAWTDADDAALEAAASGPVRPARATPGARPPEEPLRAALEALQGALGSARCSSERRHDLGLDLRALSLELERPRFARERFLARLAAVESALPALAAPAAALRAQLG